MYYFYCPNCGKEDYVSYRQKPKDTVGNLRDGFGTPIEHYECPICHNLDAGYMTTQLICSDGHEFNEMDKSYFRSVIEMYQNIRGIKAL